MTRFRLPWLLPTLGLALLLNFAGLYLLVRVNQAVRGATDVAQPSHHGIVIQPAPKPPSRPRAPRQETLQRPRSMPLPLPAIASAVSAQALELPFVGEVNLLQEVFDSESGFGTDLIMSEEAVDEAPRVLSRVAPRYPRMAEDRGIEGYVVFRLRISSAGQVESVSLVEAEPAGVFEVEAERAVRQYRFAPARYRGSPVAVMALQRLVFRLED